MDIISAIILGIVEGITEYLPISSTGHLLTAEHLLNIKTSDAFNVLIQIGPILAVCLVYWKDIISLFAGLKDADTRDEFIKLSVTFILTSILGLMAKIFGLKLPETVLPIALALVIGGVIIFIAEYLVKGKKLSTKYTWGMVFAVAISQLVAAIFPGTSRSGAVVVAALILGISRVSAVRFAFLVGIPTMLAAGAIQLKEAIELGQQAELYAPTTLVAFAVATITAWFSVVWLLKFVQTNTFKPFGWYRIIFGVILLALIAVGTV
jgi:undecaprenyl-diphosphatase